MQALGAQLPMLRTQRLALEFQVLSVQIVQRGFALEVCNLLIQIFCRPVSPMARESAKFL
ncbi:MAG: hypothetical protein ACRESE_06060 [Gammaproteobacteria bacterium]